MMLKIIVFCDFPLNASRGQAFEMVFTDSHGEGSS